MRRLRMFYVRTIAACLLVCLISVPAAAATKVLRFGKLWDGEKVITNAIVIVENDKVTAVGTAQSMIPAGAEVIDLRQYTGIPGMIDAHTHMTYYWNRAPGTSPRGQAPRHVAATVFLSQDNAKRTLEAGVTSIRDLNAAGGADFAMRDLINSGAMVGPRMFVSGQGVRGMRNRPATAPPATGTPAEEAAAGTKRAVEAGADVIKVFGSVGGFDNVNMEQTVTYDEMKAMVDTAHQMGKRIAIHSYGPDGARDAV